VARKKKRRKTANPPPPEVPITELIKRTLFQKGQQEGTLREERVPDTMSATGIDEELGELLG